MKLGIYCQAQGNLITARHTWDTDFRRIEITGIKAVRPQPPQ